MQIDPELQAVALKARDELPFFAKACLRIRTKTGDVVPFQLNRAQLHLHKRLEEQRAKTGKVRAIIVKGRQVGASTYIQGRFFHRNWGSSKSLNAYILTHELPATENLFGMAQRFYDLFEPDILKPKTLAANAKELVFADNKCGYTVATAGTKAIGRSSTIQLFHGSEAAYWANAEDHMGGVFQAVGDAPGTEIILESTANGVGNVFHRLSMAAIRGESEYEAIFIPWFWGEDYQRPCPADLQFSEEWLEYARAHKLHWEQLAWAYYKNREMAQAISAEDHKPCWKFMAEYPATFDEAFQSSGASFIPATSVLKARRPAETIIGRGPIIIGVDPARSPTGDKVGIIDRCGRRMGERICERMDPEGNLMHVASKVARIIDRIRPDAVNIDVGGIGAGVYDALFEMGYGYCINAVNFGSRPIGQGPTGDDLYFNRRAEMHDLMRDWFETEGGVQIPDRDDLHADLTAAEWGSGATRYNTSNELILEEKQHIKERLGASPDLGDAAALTFAVPFAAGMTAQNQPPPRRQRNRRTGY